MREEQVGKGQYLEYGSWDDAPALAGFAALHGVSLAGSSLPIAEQAHLHHKTKKLLTGDKLLFVWC